MPEIAVTDELRTVHGSAETAMKSYQVSVPSN